MKLRILTCVLLTSLGAGVLAAQATIDRSIMVTVFDKDGAPLRDLTAADFIVREDGQPREVSSAALATEPLTVALMVDTSKPTIGRDLPLRDIRAGLATFVKAIYAANPESKISLMDISGAAVTTVSATSNGDQMLKATSRLVASQRSAGVLLEGLMDTAKDLAKVASPRRAIVVLSFDAPEASAMQPRDAAMAVQKSGAAFWAVTVGSNTDPVRDMVFENLPPPTGGKRLTAVAATGLEKMLGDVAAALTSQYLVTFKEPAGSTSSDIRAGAKRGDQVLRASWMK